MNNKERFKHITNKTFALNVTIFDSSYIYLFINIQKMFIKKDEVSH